MIRDILKEHKAIGAAHGVSMRSLVELTGLDARKIRMQITRERRRHIICSGNTGYFLPASRKEVERFVRRFESRLITTAKNLHIARHYMKRKKKED